jgi:hypothetical protein
LHHQIIPEDKFVSLLVDYHLSVAVSYSDFYRQKTRNFKQMNINDTVLKNYGYTKAIFDSSVSFYSGNPERYDAIYDKVIATLSRMQAEIQQKMAKREAEVQKKLKKIRDEEINISEYIKEKVSDSANTILPQFRMNDLIEQIKEQTIPFNKLTVPLKLK